MGSVDATAGLHARSDKVKPGRVGSIWPRRLIGAVAAAIGLAYAVTTMQPELPLKSEGEAAATAASLPTKLTWAPITRPLHIYGLDAPDIVGPLANYEARRHILGGGRDDILTFGSFDAAAYLRLSIFRAQQDDIADTSFFLDIARGAADAGLWVSRSTITSPLTSRFGAFEVADVALGDSADPTNCLGFRFFATAPKLRISGFYCGTATHPADRSGLRCLLNRLDLVSAGEDTALRDFFVEAETRRSDGDCVSARLAGSGQKNNWLDVGAAKPSLKTGKVAVKKTR